MLYRVDLDNGNYTIVEARSIRQANRWSRWEFGNSNVTEVKRATQDDVDWFDAMGGAVHQAEAAQ